MKEALKTDNYRVAGSQKDADAISRQLSREIGVARNMKSKKNGGMINVNRGDGVAIRGKTKGRIL